MKRAIPITLLFLFNWFMLYLLLQFGVSFTHGTHGGAHAVAISYVIALLAFVILCGLAFLMDSPFGQGLLRLLSGARKPIGRETGKIEPAIAIIQEKALAELKSSPLPIKLMILDDPLPTAFSMGKETLILSRGLYETANDSELAAVIAHECAHLHNGDSHRLGIALGVSLPALIVAGISGAIVKITAAVITSHSGKEEGTIWVLFSFVLMLFAGFFGLLAKIGHWLLNLITLFVGRQQEFEADRFAVQLGYGAGLLSFLDKIKNLEFSKATGIFDRLYATHPAIMLRIGKIEETLKG